MAEYAWYFDNSVVDATSDQPSATTSHSVGLLKPNDVGVFDMFGNVLEWCANAPEGSSTTRYVRGGSHGYSLLDVKTSTSTSTPTNTEFNTLGFRIARTLEDTELKSH